MDYIILVAVFLLAGVDLWLYLRIRREQNGYRTDLTEETVAQLIDQVVYRKGKSGNEAHKKTVVSYRFQVSEVTYQTDCTLVDHFRPVPASTKMVFQRKNPQMAYLPEFEKPDVLGMSLFYLCGSVLFFLLGVLYLIIGM